MQIRRRQEIVSAVLFLFLFCIVWFSFPFSAHEEVLIELEAIDDGKEPEASPTDVKQSGSGLHAGGGVQREQWGEEVNGSMGEGRGKESSETALKLPLAVEREIEEGEKREQVREAGRTDDQGERDRGDVREEAGKGEEGAMEDRGRDNEGLRECRRGKLFVYDMPGEFNKEIVRECMKIGPDFCERRRRNWGLGAALVQLDEEDMDAARELLGDLTCWYTTAQFTEEPTYHARMLQHPCRTQNPEEALAFYIPYYAGLGVEPLIIHNNKSLKNELPMAFAKWLEQQPYFKRNGGHDHFIVLGRVGYDFHVSKVSGYGCCLLDQKALQNVTRLSVDRDLWDPIMGGIPYPTAFHPSTTAQLNNWKKRVRSVTRTNLVAFVGSTHRAAWFKFSQGSFGFRGILMDQCKGWDRCSFLDCNSLGNGQASICHSPIPILRLFLQSDFCLQPKGDTPTRKGTFDTFLAGCIPVFFSRNSAYNQYLWYLPKEIESYSVYINMTELAAGNTTIKEVLSQYTQQQIQAMRDVIIDKILPRIIVFNPMQNHTQLWGDAVDVAVEGMMVKIGRQKAGLEHQFPNAWLRDTNVNKAYSFLEPLPLDP